MEKFRAWSDCDGDPENCFTRDQLITNVMLYWVTQTSASSARLYWETKHGAAPAEALPFVDVPTGVARYPKEVLRWPRSWVERQYNVVRWEVMERGGHFPAMEQPELFVDDLRAVLPHGAADGSGPASTQAGTGVSRAGAPVRAGVRRSGSGCR